MTSFKITSSAGVDMGTYEAETAESALDAMARAAGYKGHVDAARTLGAEAESLDDLRGAEGVEGGWTTDAFRFRGGRINLFVEEVSTIHAGYVRTERGSYLVQLPDENQWGFTLYSDDQSWPGGIGASSEWDPVEEEDVPEEVREELGWILDDYRAKASA